MWNVKSTSFRLRSNHKEYINKKYLTAFGNKYTHFVGARNTLRARNTNTSVCVKDFFKFGLLLSKTYFR